MKKLFSIILCVAMILSCTAMTFATDSITTISAPVVIAPASEAKKMVLPGTGAITIDYSKLNKFSDVNLAAWYTDGLAWCAGNGLLSGKSETKMAPLDKVTRGEIVTMLWRIEGKPVVNFFMQYSDVTGDEFYGEAVRWAASEKVVDGYSDGTFKPKKTITREELAQIIYNYAKLKGNGFVDAWMFPLEYQDANTVGSWADEAMHWCVMKAIITGSNGKLNPKGLASRAEVATMFMRLNPEVPTQEAPENPALGAWVKYDGNQTLDMTKIPAEAKAAFEEATKPLTGAKYNPIAYIGSQVVAGVNYKFLCEVTTVLANADTTIKEVVITNPIGEPATILSATDISADLIGEDENIVFSSEDGGGYYYADAAGSAIDSKITEALNNATKDLDGVRYEPLAVIGQQLVAGTNYAIVVKATTVNLNPVSAVGFVKLFVGLDGTNEITIKGNLK